MNLGALQRRLAQLEAIAPKREETMRLITPDMDAPTAARIYQQILQPQWTGGASPTAEKTLSEEERREAAARYAAMLRGDDKRNDE